MIIKFNREHALMVPQGEGLPLIRVLPGVNEVDDQTWALVRPNLLDKIANKAIEEVGATIKADKDGKVTSVTGKALKDFSPAEAEALVTATLVVDLLETWKKAEKRDDIRLAIANQIEEMKKRNKPKSEQEGE